MGKGKLGRSVRGAADTPRLRWPLLGDGENGSKAVFLLPLSFSIFMTYPESRVASRDLKGLPAPLPTPLLLLSHGP